MQDGAGLDVWSSRPRWPQAQVLALPGQVRGVLLRDWAPLLDRRWGADASARVRSRVGDLARGVPDQPSSEVWLPLAAQIALTDAIIDTFLGGDASRLHDVLREDTTADLSLARRMLARAFGPQAGYKRVVSVYQRVHDVGHFEADMGDRGALLRCSGAAAFGNPTWRTLHLIGHSIALSLLTGRKDPEVLGRELGEDGFEIRVRWT